MPQNASGYAVTTAHDLARELRTAAMRGQFLDGDLPGPAFLSAHIIVWLSLCLSVGACIRGAL